MNQRLKPTRADGGLGRYRAGVSPVKSDMDAQPQTLEFEDFYETLGVSPNADQETIQAVYRFLAKRYHPDNPQTRDSLRFQRVRNAYHVLSNSGRRSEFNNRHRSLGLHRQRWSEAPLDIENDEYLRRALLWLLYVCRRDDVDQAGLGVLHFEQDLGCGEGDLEFHLWYLTEKGWVERTENGAYAITVEGVDKVTQGVVLRADRLLSKLAGGQDGEESPAQGRPFHIIRNPVGPPTGEDRAFHESAADG